MPLDAIYLTALRRELEPTLVGAKIDRITMPERDLVILSLHSREGKRKLLISAKGGAARLHYTEQSFENPPQPPMFCMLLRKYLLGARITAVEQPPMERMIALHLDTQDELGVAGKKKLVLELMGKCRNLILVDGEERVVDCLHRADFESNEKRPLLPGLFYALPPAQDKPSFFVLNAEERMAALAATAADKPMDKRLLDAFGGLSPLVCRELALSEDIDAAMTALTERVEQGDWEPTMLKEGDKPKDFSFMPVKQYGGLYSAESFESCGALLDAFYTRRDRLESIQRRSADLFRTARTARERLLRKRDARMRELKATEQREEYRRRGDLITANMYRLKKGMASFEAQDFYAEDCPTVTVPLDVLKTPQQNAAQQYKLYNKAKTAQRILTGLITDAEEEIAYLESVLDELERAESERDLGDVRRELMAGGYIRETKDKRQKLPAPRKPLRFLSDSGREILVGRGNAENDQLTFHTARRTDLWFHVQKLPGSHVVLSQMEGEADETSIRQAAILAATYSAAGGGKTAVDYTMIKNVKKPAGARPGRVIFTDYETLIVEPDAALAERLKA